MRMAFFINRSKIQSQGIVLQKKAGYCVEKALLLPTVARSLGVSGRLRFADVRNHLPTQQLKDIFI